MQQRFWIKEKKRGKRQEVVVNESIREALQEYLAAYQGIGEKQENFIFFYPNSSDCSRPIKPGQSWKFIASICREVGLRGSFGTHSLRKAWGYHARMSGVDLALIMHKLNHNSIAYTKHFLGVADDELQAVSQRLNL